MQNRSYRPLVDNKENPGKVLLVLLGFTFQTEKFIFTLPAG